MNNLGRIIKQNEKIVIKQEVLPGLSLEQRTVFALGGFGMLPGPAGKKLHVLLFSGRARVFEGIDISVDETNSLEKIEEEK